MVDRRLKACGRGGVSVFMHNSWCSRHFTLVSFVSVGVLLVQSVVISRICFHPVSLMLLSCPRWLKACLTLKRRVIPTIIFTQDGEDASTRTDCRAKCGCACPRHSGRSCRMVQMVDAHVPQGASGVCLKLSFLHLGGGFCCFVWVCRM